MALDQPDFKKHKILILETKLEILKKLSRGESGASLAKQYGVSKSTVSEIKRKGDLLLKYASTLRAEDGLKRRKTLRKASNTRLEEVVYRWFMERREAGDPISGPLICEKALEINVKLGGSSEFKASSGWLKNFKTRHNIKMQDLIIADITARVAKNKLKEQGVDMIGISNSSHIMQYMDSAVNACPAQAKFYSVSVSDSEMDSQLSNDRTSVIDAEQGYTVSFPTVTTILKSPEEEISDAVSAILPSPERCDTDTDDQEYTVSFPTVTTVLTPPDLENSDTAKDECTGPHPEVVHSPCKESSSPHDNGYTIPYSTALNQENCDAAGQRYNDSYPVTAILPDLENPDETDENLAENSDSDDRVPIKIEIKQEAPDDNFSDNDAGEEDPTGASDSDVLIALDTALQWLKRQPDRKPTHLAVLRSIRDFAIYKERLRYLTRGPVALKP